MMRALSMTSHGLLVIAGTLLMNAALVGQEGYRIVVNPANPVSSLSKDQVSQLFMEKMSWDDGGVVAAVDLMPASTVREAFTKDVFGLPVSTVVERTHEAFRQAGGTPPPSVATDREVLAFVRLKAGAIGYVSASADVQGVKVISVGRKSDNAIASTTSSTVVAVGDGIAAPQKISHTQPVYPDIARRSRVEGAVEIAVVIGSNGDVERARVVRSIPALNDAALTAVKQWKYSPTLKNGVPVQVSMMVKVLFAL